MVVYKVYIVDDEPLAIKVIQRHLSDMPGFEIIGTSTDPVRAFEEISQIRPDLIFIDVEMLKLSGLQLINALEKAPEIILTTAYREYAVDGFDLNVLDYLVKPISLLRFMRAIDKFIKKKQIESQPGVSSASKYILVRADRKNVKLVLDDLLYVEGLKDYVKVVSTNGHIHCKASVGNFLKLLPESQFMRVHKSYIVSLEKITAFGPNGIDIDDFLIPVGRTYRDALEKRMGEQGFRKE